MATEIASAALKLTTDAKAMKAGLDQAKTQVSGFVVKINDNLSMIGNDLKSFVTANMLKTLSSFTAKFWETVDAVEATDKEAKALGVSFGFMRAAEVFGEADDIGKSLKKVLINSSSAIDGNAAMQASFQRVGISVDQLRGKKPDQVFALIANAIQRIDDPAERLQALTSIAGKGGAGLREFFEGGSAGIDAINQRAADLGLDLRDDQVDQLKEVSEAWKDLKGAMDGFFLQLASHAAGPAIMALKKLKTTWQVAMEVMRDKDFGKNIDEVFGDPFKAKYWIPPMLRGQDNPIGRWLGEGEADLEAANKARARLNLPAAPSEETRAALMGDIVTATNEAKKALDNYGLSVDQVRVKEFAARGSNKDEKLAGQLANLTKLDTERRKLETLSNEPIKVYRREFAKLKELLAAGLPVEVFEAQAARLAATYHKSLPNADLTHALDSWGLMNEELKRFDLQLQGLSTKQLEEAKELLNELAGKRLTEEADPTIALRRGLDLLNVQLQEGIINETTYAALVSKNLKAAEGDLNIGGKQLPSVAVQGSKEAAETIIRSQAAVPQTLQERLNRIMEQQRDLQKLNLEELKKLNGKQVVEVVF